MLKSRRSGLVAAGLAVAVVGALGVVWTLNANAEQIPTGQDALLAPVDVQADTTAGDVSTPPPNLPWGVKPVHGRRAPAGTTSRQLRDDGLQAATGMSRQHLDFAPKGKVDIKPPEPAPSPSGSTDSPAGPPTDQPTTPATSPADPGPAATSPTGTSPTDTSPTGTTATTVPAARPTPVNPVAAAAAAAVTPPGTGGNNDTKFLYTAAVQKATADGLYAAMDVKRPVVGKGDFHSLAEVAVQTEDQKQTVEVGWTVDRAVNGDSDPHLFVFHWVNGAASCYNACGFVPYNDGINAGDTLPVDTTKKFGIEHRNGAWWIAYDTTWIGSFPDSLWSKQGATFTNGGFFQAFGEVAASSFVPCTEMGDGQFATTPVNGQPVPNSGAARIGSLTFINGPTPAPNISITTNDPQVSTNQYGMVLLPKSTRSFYYGGTAATATSPSPSPSPSASTSPNTPATYYNANC